MKKKCALLSLVLSFMLVFTLVIPAFATAETLPDAVNGEDIVDEVVEEIIEDGDFTRSEEAEIEEDVEALYEIGVPIEEIESVDENNDELVYVTEYNDGTVNEITVEETSGDEVVMNVVEDNIENEFIVTADGKMFVDGNEIKFDDDSNIEDAYSEEDVMMLNTGGWSWSTSKPSKIKSYANLNKLNWSCRSVTFSTAIMGITTTVIIAALTKKCPDAGLGMGCVSAIVSAFKSSDPYSKGLSYKVYIGTAVSPKSSRYCKSGTIYYSKTGYKGISKTKYLYGTMI